MNETTTKARLAVQLPLTRAMTPKSLTVKQYLYRGVQAVTGAVPHAQLKGPTGIPVIQVLVQGHYTHWRPHLHTFHMSVHTSLGHCQCIGHCMTHGHITQKPL